MAMKMISVLISLMLSCLILYVTGQLKITEDQYAKFKGIDPAESCCNRTAMLDICKRAGKLAGEKHLNPVPNYPQCLTIEINLLSCSGKHVKKNATLLVCGWKMGSFNRFYVYGKGQNEGRVMNYDGPDLHNDIDISSTAKDD